MPTNRRPMLIDTDTASDDAVALLMALRDPAVDVVAITVVAGNVPLDRAVQNALFTVEQAGAGSVPVHAGRAAPMARDLFTAEFVHGQDGMGDIGLDLTGREPAGTDAVGAIIDTIRAHEPGALDLVTLGPLTNVAIAFLQDPALATRLRSLTVMGGTGDAVGNVSAVAEFNLFVDPEAAAVVFAAGAPLTMVGWDISRKYAVIDHQDAARIRALGPLGALAIDINGAVDAFATSQTHLAGFDLPDPIAMAVALDPSIATVVEHRNVVVETAGDHTAGQTVVDHLGLTGRAPNTHVVVEASRVRFLALLEARLGG
jgi:purine nucleosidase